MSDRPSTPWFADEPGDFLLYRVNRRPLEGVIFPIPGDVFDHFLRVFAPGREIVTGRRHRRSWRVGGLRVDAQLRVVTGNLGWVPYEEEVVVPVWSDEEDDWMTTTTAQRGGRVVPFGFDGETRLLTILRDPGTPPDRFADVLERLLRAEENELTERSTEWAVEPVLDEADFVEWLHRVDVVRLVSFAARLPNPEPTDADRDLVERMQRRRATLYRETMRSNREEGLVGIEDDPDFRQAISMGRRSFATLRGEAIKDGAVVHYSQTETVAKEHVNSMPPTWEQARALIVDLLRTRLQRFLEWGVS